MADLNEDLNSFASEHSFVILGQGSLTPEDDTLQSTNSHQYNSCVNSQSNSLHEGNASPNSRPQAPSPSEIQVKLDLLVKENLLLKETLNHSNLAMKNQFDTLALWHDEVVKTHESHKQRFRETQEHILKLQNENVELKKLIQQNLNKCSGNSEASDCAHKEGIDTSMEMGDVVGKEFNSNDNYTKELKMKNAELEKKLNDMTEEKLEMEKKLKELVEENSKLKSCDKPNYDKCIQCQGVTNSSTIKNSDVKKEESSREASLESDMSVFERPTESFRADLAASEMREEIALMKQRLAAGLQSWEEKDDKMKELRIQNEEITRIKDKLEDELKSYKTEVERLKEETDRFSNELKKKDDMLEKKNQELEENKKNVKDLEMMCENIAVLETQVELYRKDFNEERKAREEAIAEKEKFAELVRSLGRLQQNERKKSDQSSPSSKNQEELKCYPCPKCWTRFSNLRECEDHVNDCLNSDIFP